MKRLKIFIIIFCVALSVPLAYLVLQTYRGLEQEEESTLRYFAEALFDEMEKELTSIVIKEEGRAIDEYNYQSIPSGLVPGSIDAAPSPLSQLPEKDYIIGYLQNNPDGSFQTPLIDSDQNVPSDRITVVSQLKEMNKTFNTKRFSVAGATKAPVAKAPLKVEEKQEAGFADRYLDLSKSQKPKAYLGRKEKRVEQITMAQAQRIAPQDKDAIAKGRRTLNITIALLAVVVLMGLFAIYTSARTVVDLSERRSNFVSSVTHELKTPLTNIRMYIEML